MCCLPQADHLVQATQNEDTHPFKCVSFLFSAIWVCVHGRYRLLCFAASPHSMLLRGAR